MLSESFPCAPDIGSNTLYLPFNPRWLEDLVKLGVRKCYLPGIDANCIKFVNINVIHFSFVAKDFLTCVLFLFMEASTFFEVDSVAIPGVLVVELVPHSARAIKFYNARSVVLLEYRVAFVDWWPSSER